MYDRILVPLDGSELAEQVLPYVEILAPKLQAEVLFLRAINPELLARYSPEGPLPVDIYERIIEAETAVATEYLDNVAKRLRAGGVVVRRETVFGPPASAIIDAANRGPGTTLVAMTTHGRTGLARFALGSVAELVVRGADAPVLLVRALAERPTALAPIMVPLDGSPLAEAILPSVEALAPALAAPVLLVRALERHEAPDADIYLAEVDGAGHPLPEWMFLHTFHLAQIQEYLERVSERLRRAGVVEVCSQVVGGPAAAAITNTALRERVGLIAMATHGRSGIVRWALGSVADRILHTATVPVLLVRGREQPPQEK